MGSLLATDWCQKLRTAFFPALPDRDLESVDERMIIFSVTMAQSSASDFVVMWSFVFLYWMFSEHWIPPPMVVEGSSDCFASTIKSAEFSMGPLG